MMFFLAPVAVSFFVCVVLVALNARREHSPKVCLDTSAVQASHTKPTSRLGGLAVMAGMLSGGLLAYYYGEPLYLLLLVTAIPMFAMGVAEDVLRETSTIVRYLMAAFSALCAIAIIGVRITHADAVGLDWLLAFAPFAVLMTVFVVASFCHAFNLIDGLNGLASGTGILVAIGLAAIATKAGEQSLVTMCAITAFSILGFFIINFPAGRIFLGDGGAYIIGYMLTWIALILLHRAPEIAGWAMFLVFFWPLADTIFAIFRRRRRGVSLDTADRLHYHQLVLRGIEITILGRSKRDIANPIATSVMLPFIAVPIIAGVIFWDDPVLSFIALALFGAIFVTSYRIGVKAAKAFKRKPDIVGAAVISPAE